MLKCTHYNTVFPSIYIPIVLFYFIELPPLRDLKVKMSLEQNQVMLNWTRPSTEIISSDLTLSYKLFYTVRGVCTASTCQADMCRVSRRIRSRQNSVMFNQDLFPYANYTWLLELTYTNDGLTIEHHNVSVDAQTSQSGEHIITNSTHLNCQNEVYFTMRNTTCY